MISCSHWGMFEIPVPVGEPLPSQVNDYARRTLASCIKYDENGRAIILGIEHMIGPR